MKKNFNPLLSNFFVLYFFLFMTVIQIFIFLNIKDFHSLFFLIVIGLIISYFQKNMIVVLCLSLVITNIFKYGIKSFLRVNEGFQDAVEDEDITTEKKKNENKPKQDKINSKKKVKKEDKTNDDDITKMEKEDDKLVELKKEFPEFKDIQSEIIKGIDKISPLLKKAEGYMQKYETFKNNKNDFIKDVLHKDKK